MSEARLASVFVRIRARVEMGQAALWGAVRTGALVLLSTVTILLSLSDTNAADHADTEWLNEIEHLADFYVFTQGANLVLAVTIAADLSGSTSAFRFADDIEYSFLINRDSPVSGNQSDSDDLWGRMIDKPHDIEEDLAIDVRLADQGASKIASTSGTLEGDVEVKIFAGVLDDPFIRSIVGKEHRSYRCRTSFERRRAVVQEAHGPRVVDIQSGVSVYSFRTPFWRSPSGRALRKATQFAGQGRMECLSPQPTQTGRWINTRRADLRLSEKAVYPNGRGLEDDVVKILGRPDDGETESDVPFLRVFLYLSPPHE